MPREYESRKGLESKSGKPRNGKRSASSGLKFQLLFPEAVRALDYHVAEENNWQKTSASIDAAPLPHLQSCQLFFPHRCQLFFPYRKRRGCPAQTKRQGNTQNALQLPIAAIAALKGGHRLDICTALWKVYPGRGNSRGRLAH